MTSLDDPTRCKAVVYVRDTYRYTGRKKSGFELHYNRKQCSRQADTTGFCWQHTVPAGKVDV